MNTKFESVSHNPLAVFNSLPRITGASCTRDHYHMKLPYKTKTLHIMTKTHSCAFTGMQMLLLENANYVKATNVSPSYNRSFQ